MAAAAACAALLALTWLASFHVGFLEHADQNAFVGFYDLTYLYYRARVDSTVTSLVSLCNTTPYAYFAAFSVVLALARRSFRVACAVGVLLIGANLTTLVFKSVLPEPRTAFVVGVVSPVPYPRWPSGHATAAMALVLALVFAAPARLRPFVAGVGAVFAAAVSYSVLAVGSHLPSDAIGGFLVAAMWGLLAVAALIASEARAVRAGPPNEPVSIREVLGAPATALVTFAVAAAIVVLLSPHQVVAYLGAHEPFVVGAAIIAALSTGISTAVAISLRGVRI